LILQGVIVPMYFYITCRRGCPRRSIDTSTIYNYLKLNGWQSTKRIRRADLCIVYTCGGFETTERRSLITIDKVLEKKKRKAPLVVTGCLLKINPNIVNGHSRYLKIEHQNLLKLDDIIKAKISFLSVPDANIVSDICDLFVENNLLKKSISQFRCNWEYARKVYSYLKKQIANGNQSTVPFSDDIYNIKIAHGCPGNCSYCAIKNATGKLRSKLLSEILSEFNEGLALGFKRFVLLAEDTGAYGIDIGTDIVELLEEIFSHNSCFSLIINDFNPRWFIKFYNRLLPVFAENRERIEDIRIPIQSGSDRILGSMKRPYTSGKVAEVILDLKSKIPELKIHTHILIGFPGETQSDFEQTQRLLKDLNFHKVSLYCYEDRPNTKSFTMPDKIPFNVKMERIKTLQDMIPL
jgi:MiaB/RimO family radical SAM methylthiotransferase